MRRSKNQVQYLNNVVLRHTLYDMIKLSLTNSHILQTATVFRRSAGVRTSPLGLSTRMAGSPGIEKTELIPETERNIVKSGILAYLYEPVKNTRRQRCTFKLGSGENLRKTCTH